MLTTPKEHERIADRNIGRHVTETFAMLRKMLESSEIVARKQRELDALPGRRFYSAVTLILSYAAKEIFGMRYADIRTLMPAEAAAAIGYEKISKNVWKIPSGSTVHEFMTGHLVPMLDDLCEEFAVSAVSWMKTVHRGEGYVVLTLDSTPAQASRYNFDAEYNGHYRIRMDKMHIVMMDGIPLFMVPTGGNKGDTEPVEELFEKYNACAAEAGMDRNMTKIMLDGGYDSFDCFETVRRLTGVGPGCRLRSNAVIHPEAEWENIRTLYSSVLHRLDGFDPNRKNDRDFVFAFLKKHGYGELVGQCIRNDEIRRQAEQEKNGIKDTDRQVCETMHHSMKSWLDFTTLKIRHKTRHTVLRCRFYVSQLLSVAMKGYVDYSRAFRH